MAKRSKKSHARCAKDRLVRVWGLINILDFRHFRSPRKMLTYRRQRCRDTVGSGTLRYGIEESHKFDENLRGTHVDPEGTASVKTLIEKEMGEESKQSDSRVEGRRRKKKSGKEGKTRSKQSQSLNHGDLDGKKGEFKRQHQTNTEQDRENSLSEKDRVEELCRQIYPNHVEGRLCDAVKEVLSQQFSCRKHKELVEVIENWQDSLSLRVKASDPLNYSRNKDEVREIKSSNEIELTQVPNPIVILKPELIRPETACLQNPVRDKQSAGITRRSFLSSLKRRLRSALSLSKDRVYIEKASRVKDGEKNHKMAGNSDPKESKIYTEAKKYLSEMLKDGDDGSEILAAAFRDKLGRILSLPEFSYSPEGSPSKDTCINAKSRFSPVIEFPIEVGNIADSNPVVPEEQTVGTWSSIYERFADETAFATVDHMNLEDNTGESDDSSPQSCSSGKLSETSDENYCDQHVRKNFDDKTGPMLSPSLSRPNALFTGKEDIEIGIDKAEQPSPVSVLDALFTEEDYSPTRTTSRSREHPLKLLQIEFEDRDDFTTARDLYTETLDKGSVIDYVQAVLHSLGPNWDDLYLQSLSSDQLLELSLLKDVDIFRDFHFHDEKLLLDCINEVLLEFCDHYFVLPCFYFCNKMAISKVCERVYWHILQPPLPRTLEQIASKDLSGAGVWLDLPLEAKTLGIDMGEIILKELIQELYE